MNNYNIIVKLFLKYFINNKNNIELFNLTFYSKNKELEYNI